MILSLAVFSAALLLTGCSAEADGAYKKISSSEAKEMMDKGNVTIVDVREPSEYAGGHVPGAMLLPLGTVSSSAEKALPDKDAVLLVYCRSGVRSLKASRSSFPWATSTSMTLAAFLTGLMKSRNNIPLNKNSIRGWSFLVPASIISCQPGKL